MKISIDSNKFAKIENLPFETVERKGIGHPDTLCDAIAEVASRNYSKKVYEMVGKLPHHYFDKVMLMGGAADMGLGHGKLVSPYRVIFAGKVTRRVGDIEFPVTQIITDAAKEVLSDILVNFDVEKDLVVMDELRDYQGPSKKRPRYQPETIDAMPDMHKEGRVSNDVNLCVGFAPLSRCEQATLDIERLLNSKEFKKKHPYTGSDIKVSGVRMMDQLEITINMPFIASLVHDMDEYKKLTGVVSSEIKDYFKKTKREDITLNFNPQDVSGIPYLTVTGSVADTGDVGVVGRGNRQNGLITPMRPMSIEAVSGKSPIDNTGKMYGIMATRISAKIYEEFKLWNHVAITTFRDRPLTDPAFVQVSIAKKITSQQTEELQQLIEDMLMDTPSMTEEFVMKGITSW